MRRIVIIGAGAQGREVLEILRHQAQTQSEIQALGFIDDDIKLRSQIIDGAPVLGTFDWFQGVDRGEVAVICASGFRRLASTWPTARRRLACGLLMQYHR
jgi:FlaA1/EpsC-like NDP-sugar epimerase